MEENALTGNALFSNVLRTLIAVKVIPALIVNVKDCLICAALIAIAKKGKFVSVGNVSLKKDALKILIAVKVSPVWTATVKRFLTRRKKRTRFLMKYSQM
tara:strand:- start:116 stop:415 length:300 start_codon:yes stop_codon:yes gene_type:complete